MPDFVSLACAPDTIADGGIRFASVKNVTSAWQAITQTGYQRDHNPHESGSPSETPTIQKQMAGVREQLRDSLSASFAELLRDLGQINTLPSCSQQTTPTSATSSKRSLPVKTYHSHSKKNFKADSVAPENKELHQLCCQSGVTSEEIRNAIIRDPLAPSRKVLVPTIKRSYNPITGLVETKRSYEPYQYALNLAIRSRASLDVIRTLLAAAPDVVDLPDGAQEEKSLHIILKYSPKNVKAVDALLLHKPRTHSPLDKQQNTVIHNACRYGASLPVIRHLIIMFPDALQQRNFYNETCAELAQRNSVMCSSEVASYVLLQTNKGILTGI